jgi:inorganic pyrophosphatase
MLGGLTVSGRKCKCEGLLDALLPPIGHASPKVGLRASPTVPKQARKRSIQQKGIAMIIDNVTLGKNVPEEVNVIIEVPIGGEPIKYEMDKASGALMVDRFLYTSMRYPGNYGFIPHTLSDDGDPCDVIIANTRAIIPGAIMSVRPVGVLFMEDEAGGDEKILAVPASKLTRRYENVNNYTDLPAITLDQIQHFFERYKDLEPGKWVKVVRWGTAEEARTLIKEGIERAKNAKAK